MLLSDYDLINYLRQLFKVWFTNCTLWNWKQEIELFSPPETSFHLAQNLSESWLNLCCFAWLGLTSVFGFHEIIKGHFWLDFLQLQPKLIRTKSKTCRSPGMTCTPVLVLLFRLARIGVCLRKWSVEAMMTNNYPQPWKVRYITSCISVPAGSVGPWTNMFSESAMVVQGNWILREMLG